VGAWQKGAERMNHVCQNCGARPLDGDLSVRWPNIPNLHERLDPGGTVPSGECPDCGALVYPVEQPASKATTSGGIRWRCDNCGQVETTTDDPVELAASGPPMCPECVDRQMGPCETNLQPMLDALSRCAFVLFKITEGDEQAIDNALNVVWDSVKLLQEYGEQDEWMEETSNG